MDQYGDRIVEYNLEIVNDGLLQPIYDCRSTGQVDGVTCELEKIVGPFRWPGGYDTEPSGIPDCVNDWDNAEFCTPKPKTKMDHFLNWSEYSC